MTNVQSSVCASDGTPTSRIDRQTADQLNYSELLVRSSPTGIITYRATGEVVSANPAIARIIGGTEEEVAAQNFRHLDSWKRSGLLRTAEEALASGAPQKIETQLVTSFGKDVYLSIKFIPFQHDRELHLLALFVDVGERRKTEEALQQQAKLQEQLVNVAATVPGIIYSFRLRPDGFMSMPYASGALENVFGIKPEQVRENAAPAFALIHADDLAQVHSSIAESARTLSPWHAEFRVRQKCGEEVWVEANSVPQRENDGSVLWHGFIQDITARKNSEDAWRESEAQYRALIETTATGFVIVDGEGRVVDANDEYVRLSGHERREEILGRSVVEWTDPQQRERNEEEIRKCMEQGSARTLEINYIDRHGRITPIEINATVVRTKEGDRILTLCRDITERKESEAALRASEERFKLAMQGANDGLWDWDLKTDAVYYSPRWKSMLGYADNELEHHLDTWKRLTHPDDSERALALVRDVLEGRAEKFEIEFRMQHKDGHYLDILSRAFFSSDQGGRKTRLVGTHVDISERKKLESELILRERRLDSFFSGATAGLAFLDRDLRFVRINDTLADMNGIPADRHLGRTVQELVPGLASSMVPILRKVITSGQPVFNLELSGETARQPGVQRHWIESFFPIAGRDGSPEGVGAIVVEVTELKRAGKVLRESERRFRDMLENVELIAMTLDKRGIVTFCNDYLLRLTGWRREEVVGADWFANFLPDTRPEVKKMFFDNIQLGTIPRHYENPIRTRSGELREIVWNNTILRDAAGNILGTASIGEDVTERKRTEQALRASEERFRQLAENIRGVFWMSDPLKNQLLYVSPAYETIWGRPCETIYESPGAWLDAIHPEDRPRILDAVLTKQREGTYNETYRIVRPDGSMRWIHDRAFPLRNEQGVYRVVGIAEDITEQKQLEAEFRQAQKMESIGQLAGGVAHDFNNLLTVIQGHASLMPLDPDLSESGREAAEQISLAAERAANLTRQLLTFSRRQVIQSRELNLNDVVAGVTKMLERVVGEDVALEFNPSDLPRVVADAGMLEQILMNLAVNARDAMPRGGSLTIRTGVETVDEAHVQQNPEAAPGQFVWLSVADTGCGIPPENVSKIFEPFFTTKEVGKGTGLGLATVYGIVKQHGGWLTVQSEVAKGTTFRIHLPATAGKVGASQARRADESVRGGTETILLVEDDAHVRRLSRHTLESYGYRVIEADSGRMALLEWEKHRAEIDMVLTDLVMPGGMTGRELADALRIQSPEIKVAFMSGYSLEITGKDFRLQPGINFLQKPFPPRSLGRCVRECLDANGTGSTPPQ